MTPEKFTRRMDAVANMFQANVGEAMVRAALTAHSTVVLATPVDTGRARGSWRVAVGAPAAGTATTPAEFGAAASMAAARQALEGYGKRRASLWQRIKAFVVGGNPLAIHITNNLPYIQRLNEGHSKQAPAMFVEMAIAAAQQQLKQVDLTKNLNIRMGG